MGNELELIRALTALKQKEEENKLADFRPYDCQLRFANTTALTSALIAGNQIGKTTLVSFMVACHLTGLYPDWWKGIRIPFASEWWAVGKDGAKVRDTIQRKLFGNIGRMGTGMIPKHLINMDTIIKGGVSKALDRVDIKHVDGGWSNVQFLAYDQGLEKFMSNTLTGGAWLDEEPPADINTEVNARLMANNGILLYSFTPVDGVTPLYNDLMEDDKVFKVFISQDEVPHLTEEAKARFHKGMDEATLSARRDGIAKIGDGKVFHFEESDYSIEPFEIPPYWRRLGGLDVGLTHPTGALMAAIDDDSKTIYITNEYRVSNKTAIDHAAHLKHWGVTFMTDPHAFDRMIGTGTSTASIYQEEGLSLRKANNAVDASIAEIRKLIGEGRLYIFSTCTMLLKEMKTYRTRTPKEGGPARIVKVNDDLIDPMRYLLMDIDANAEVPKRFKRSPKLKQFKPADPKVAY
jgi:phage terminase large subunit-like protein